MKITDGDIKKAQNSVVIIEDFERLSMDERLMPQLVSEETNIDLDERSILNGYDGALWHRLCPIFREVEIEKENNK